MSKIAVKIGIIGGSGIDNPDILENRKEKIISTPYGSTEIVEGTISSVPCVLLARHGKNHGIMPGNVNYRSNISALRTVGCTHILATTATGSLQENIKPGDIVILSDFIDRTTKRCSTFYDGSEMADIGVCHLPCYPAFDEKTRQCIISCAKELGIPVVESGTVVTIEGPRFSSRAESNVFRSWKADLINMTTVPEVVLAKEAGMCYASIAMATDYDCWRESEKSVCVTDVLEMFKKNIEKVTKLLIASVPLIAKSEWTDTINELKVSNHLPTVSSNKLINFSSSSFF